MSTESIVLTVVLWTAFGLQHSLLAQKVVKDMLARVLGRTFLDHGYRFCYFLSQCIVYPAFWYFVSHLEPGHMLWRVPEPLYPAVHILKVLGHFLLLLAVISADVNTFIGTKQLFAYLRARITRQPLPTVTVFGEQRLVVTHVFKLIRHPMYLGIILSLATSSANFSEKLVLNLVCLIIYVQVGIYFEERQLIRIFGSDYEDYKKRVPRLIPIFWRRAVEGQPGK